jgi:hypothetical protein
MPTMPRSLRVFLTGVPCLLVGVGVISLFLASQGRWDLARGLLIWSLVPLGGCVIVWLALVARIWLTLRDASDQVTAPPLVRLTVVAAVMVAIAYLVLVPILPLATGPVSAGGDLRLPPLLVQGAIWLILTTFLLVLCRLVLLGIYRRRHIGDIRLRDASAEPAPMRAFEQSWDTELRSLGFRYLGVLELTGPLDRPEKWWNYADLDGRIGAEIGQRLRYVCFSTVFQDGAMLVTRNRPVLPTIQLQSHQAMNAPKTAGSLAQVYQAHLVSLQPFAAAHGEAIRRQDMADVLAVEERSRETAVREVHLLRTWKDRAGEAFLLVVVFGGWLVQSRQVLDLL